MDVLPWSGSEELWFLAATELLKQGHEVNAIYPAYRGYAKQLDELRAQGAVIMNFGASITRWGLLRRRLRSVFFRRHNSTPCLYPSKGVFGELTVLSQGAVFDGMPWLTALKKSGVPYSIICQANLESHWPNDNKAVQLRELFASARRAFFVSRENLRLFRMQTGYDLDNLETVWNPLQPNTPELPLPWPNSKSLKLAMVGRVEPFVKGQDLMLDVMSLDKWRNRDISITVYGKGPWLLTLKKIIGDRQLTRVHLGGYANPEEIWREHHVLLLPSRHEGKSLAMLEALWLGRPVIATAVAGAVEEISDGQNGFLARAPTAALLDEALEKLWQSRNRLEAMGEAASQNLRKRMPGRPAEKLAKELVQIAGG